MVKVSVNKKSKNVVKGKNLSKIAKSTNISSTGIVKKKEILKKNKPFVNGKNLKKKKKKELIKEIVSEPKIVLNAPNKVGAIQKQFKLDVSLIKDKSKEKKLNSHQRRRKKAIAAKVKLLKEKKKKSKAIAIAKKSKDTAEEGKTSIENPQKVKKSKKKKNNKKVVNGDSKAVPVADNERKKIPLAISENWLKLKDTVAEKDKQVKESTQKRKTEALSKSSSKMKKNDSAAVWFDNVDPDLLDSNSTNASADNLITDLNDMSITKAVAIDCEMVGVGLNGSENHLARVSIVNQSGNVLYDKYVKPRENVTDYRTQFSGIRPADIENGEKFETVQQEVSEFLKDRILVGHAVHHDLQCLLLSHPKSKIRDTSTYRPLRQVVGGGTPSLKKLALKILSMEIQTGEHSSVQDAQVTMRVYTLNRKEWEKYLKELKKKGKEVEEKTAEE